MSGKKILHELSVDDLIRLATKSTETITFDKVTDAARFIYELGIKHGDAKISAQLVYWHYKEWKGRTNKPQTKRYFFRDFRKYFDVHRTTDGFCYLLDPRSFDLSKDVYWLIRMDMRNEKQNRKKAK